MGPTTFGIGMALILGSGLVPQSAATVKPPAADSQFTDEEHPSFHSSITGIRMVPTEIRSPPSTQWCRSNWQVSCYSPAQIRTAYNLDGLAAAGIKGRGQTIVIVDSFGSPTLAADLARFDRAFGLPDPPSIRVIQPAGPVPAFDPNDSEMAGWASETTLDVQWAHAIAPRASIVVAVTPTSEIEGTTGFPDMITAENYVIDHGLGNVISQSFGATEATFPDSASVLALRSAFKSARNHGVTVLAATGDSGATDVGLDTSTYYTHPVVNWPASDPLVTAVGGTHLELTTTGTRTAPDVAWNDSVYANLVGSSSFPIATGGGLSAFFDRPSYQDLESATTGGARGIPDVSMNGACSSMVVVYQGYSSAYSRPGWYEVCGTSVSTPLFAGIVALADQVAGHGLGLINDALYSLARQTGTGVKDVTEGNNSVPIPNLGGGQTIVDGFTALSGYDLVSGIGTINAKKFVPALAHWTP